MITKTIAFAIGEIHLSAEYNYYPEVPAQVTGHPDDRTEFEPAEINILNVRFPLSSINIAPILSEETFKFIEDKIEAAEKE
jgi:hypothetical protein